MWIVWSEVSYLIPRSDCCRRKRNHSNWPTYVTLWQLGPQPELALEVCSRIAPHLPYRFQSRCSGSIVLSVHHDAAALEQLGCTFDVVSQMSRKHRMSHRYIARMSLPVVHRWRLRVYK